MQRIPVVFCLLSVLVLAASLESRGVFGQTPPPSPTAPVLTIVATTIIPATIPPLITPTPTPTSTPILLPGPPLLATPTRVPPTATAPPPAPTSTPRPVRTATRVPTATPTALVASPASYVSRMQAAVRRADSYHLHTHLVQTQADGTRLTADINVDSSHRKQQVYYVEVGVILARGGRRTHDYFAAIQVGQWETTRSDPDRPWSPCQRVARVPPLPPQFANLTRGNLVSLTIAGPHRVINGISVVPILVRSHHVLDQGNNVLASNLFIALRGYLLIRETVYYRASTQQHAQFWLTTDYSHWGQPINVKLPIRCG